MQQRTKLAQALVHGPDVVLLDEPTSGLDPAGREEMLAIVRRLSTELGIRVVASSHVLDDIERTCDEVVVLRSGTLAAQRPVVVGHDPSGRRNCASPVTSGRSPRPWNPASRRSG